MQLELKIGLNAIDSYRRLAYTPWHALAEFIDNSTQSYFDNKEALDKIFADDGNQLEVGIVYERKQANGFLRIVDNAMGMNENALVKALHVSVPPDNPTGRSRYGMGMKTAACWIGNRWTIRTKKLGETEEYTVEVVVSDISGGNPKLPTTVKKGLPKKDHYTIIEIHEHNRQFKGRTLGKIKDFLRSMYRLDFQNGTLRLEWQAENLVWEGLDGRLLRDKEGKIYKRTFKFQANGKDVHGWAGVLDRGGRADAGFSILHCDRVVRGWPDSWRPEKIFGQGGRNDLINQRLVGEIHLDGFDVSHTKDDILWFADGEEKVEQKLQQEIQDFINVARTRRKGKDDERGPTEGEIDTALAELKEELTSKEMIDQIAVDVLPPKSAVKESIARLTGPIKSREPTIRATLADLEIMVFLVGDLSPNDPYIVVDSADYDKIIVVINGQHPHMSQIEGSVGVANFFRHCIYDAIAEWQVRRKTAQIDPDTVKLLKDRLLRISLLMEEHAEEAEGLPPAPGIAGETVI